MRNWISKLVTVGAASAVALTLGACTDDTSGTHNGEAGECVVAQDCDDGFVCTDGYCVDDDGNDSNDGNDGNDGNDSNDGNDGNDSNDGNDGNDSNDGNDGNDSNDGNDDNDSNNDNDSAGPTPPDVDPNDQCTIERDADFVSDEVWSFAVDSTMPYETYEGSGSYSGNSMNQVMMTPVVIDLDNDGDEIPDVVFTTFATSEETTGWDFLVTGVLRAVSGDDGAHKWSVGYEELGAALGLDPADWDPALGFMPAGSIAAGDITGDGTNEVVAPIWDFSSFGAGPQGLAAVDHEGDVLWISDDVAPQDIEQWWGGPSIADLNGDGNAEIIVGSVVYNNDGEFQWDGRDAAGLQSQFATGSNFEMPSSGVADDAARIGPLSVVSDLDGDGTQEIITGRATFNYDGTLMWETTGVDPAGNEMHEGFPGVADFDGDGDPEVVVVSAGTVRIHDGISGDLVWGPVDIPDAGRLGPPTIADMTGDDQLEIGVAGSNGYFVLEVDTSTFGNGVIADYSNVLVWEQTTQDQSSNTTGSSVFDFNGDGTASIIYNDELYLRVFDGPTGDIIFEVENPSFTALENPVIADVNNDGTANIIVPTSDFECGKQITGCTQGQAGIQVYGDGLDNWVTTRRIWNQHAYSINNVEEDGTIPVDPTPNYLDHNTFRLNQLTTVDPQAAPDLFPTPEDELIDGCYVLTDIWVSNGGAVQVGPGIPVSMYATDGVEKHLIATGETQDGLAPGESELVIVDGQIPVDGTWDIVVIVDDDDGVSTRNECNEDNNRIVIAEDVVCG